jgi:hypothetical protein
LIAEQIAQCESVWHYWRVTASRYAIRKRAWTAAVAGLLISASLFAFSWDYLDVIGFLWWPRLLFWPQFFLGFVAGFMLGGDPLVKARIAAVTIPINAVIYAMVIFCVTRIISGSRTSPSSSGILSQRP